ncbi:MAG: efflux RND transporter periplasmic adaptor subunit, partial [Bryobacteraceae bacterium]
EEIDRARLSAGQEVRLLVDALPERPLKAKLRMISPLTEQNWEWPPTRNFRAHAELTEVDTRLRPGMNGRMDIILQRRPNTMSIPAKALYSRHGRPIAYVAAGRRFRVAPVAVVARNTDEIAITGLQPGQSVAMAEVEAKDLTQ